MIKAFDGKDFHELVAGGIEKMSAMGTAAAPTGPAPAETPKVEEAPVKEEIETVEMGNIFGGDDEYY